MNWLAISCAYHVERGLQGGFMQVCHGKSGPLRQIGAGDTVIYYSPSRAFGARDGLMSFTAFGRAAANPPFEVDMGGGFVPFRRHVEWIPAHPAPIRPLLQTLDLTAGKTNWAYPFRFGILPLSDRDRDRIAKEMAADPTAFDAHLPRHDTLEPPLPLFERLAAEAR